MKTGMLKTLSGLLAGCYLLCAPLTVIGQSTDETAKVRADEVNQEAANDSTRSDVSDALRAHALAKQIEQTALAIQQISQHLEALEKLENGVLGSDIPSRIKFLQAAELLGVHSKEHLEKVSDLLRQRAAGTNPNLLQEAEMADRYKKARELTVAKQLSLLSSHDDQYRAALARQEAAKLLSVAELGAAQRRDTLAVTLAAEEQQKASAMRAELLAREKMLEQLEHLARKEKHSVTEQAGITSAETSNEVKAKFESIESRLSRIEALLKKLVDDK